MVKNNFKRNLYGVQSPIPASEKKESSDIIYGRHSVLAVLESDPVRSTGSGAPPRQPASSIAFGLHLNSATIPAFTPS